MRARFQVKMTQKVMFDFLLHHMYRGFAGIFSILFGLGLMVLGIATYGKVSSAFSILYFGCAIYALPLQPLMLYFKAARQVKLNPAYREALYYEIDEEGVTTRQKGQKGQIGWEKIVRVTETGQSLLLYTGKRYACVLPKESMGRQTAAVKELIRRHLSPAQIKMKTN